MCCFIAEIIISIYGIVVLITGKIAISGGRYCYGMPARIAGGILMATFPLAFASILVLGVVIAASGKSEISGQDAQKIETLGMVVNAIVVVLCLVTALIVALTNSGPKRKPKLDIEEGYDEKYIRRSRHDDRRDEPRPDEDPDDRITD